MAARADGDAEAAQAAWGWAGMAVTVERGPLEWGVAALTDATGWPSSCRVQVDPELETARTLTHEVGHCLGYYNVDPSQPDYWRDHSADPESLMYPFARPGQRVTADDMRVIWQTRQWYSRDWRRLVIPEVAR